MVLPALVLVAFVPGGLGQTVRVTTWNLQPPTARTNAAGAITNGIRIPVVAAALQKLDPDIILLQQVSDWTMCDELAQSLQPAKYNVVACSAFREARTGALRKQQVAILAKANAKSYFSWSEPWRNRVMAPLPGGFAFAALQFGKQRVGVFSAQTVAPGPGPAPTQPNAAPKQPSAAAKQQKAASQEERLAAAVEQLLQQVSATSNWASNRVQAFVVGGSFSPIRGQEAALPDEPLALLQDAGFGDAFEGAPPEERATVRGSARQANLIADYLFTLPATCASNPAVQRLVVSRRFPVTCDVRLGGLPAVAAHKVRPPPVPAGRTNGQLQPEAPIAATAKATPPLPKPPQAPASLPAANDNASQPTQSLALPTAGRAPAPERLHASDFYPHLLWLAAALGSLVALVAVAWALIWRKRARSAAGPALLSNGEDAPSGYTVVMSSQSASESTTAGGSRPSPTPSPLIHMEVAATTQTQTEALRRRALAAEERAERALALVRAGLIPQLGQWLKQTLVRRLITDRAQLLQTQQAAALKAMAVEQRLTRIEQQVQQQLQVYEQRIEELSRELAVAREENRELIRARIAQVKADMEAARARLMAQQNADGPA